MTEWSLGPEPLGNSPPQGPEGPTQTARASSAQAKESCYAIGRS